MSLKTMPIERQGTEKESSPPIDKPATTDTYRDQESRQSMSLLQGRSTSNVGVRSKLKFTRKRPDDSEKKVISISASNPYPAMLGF